MLAEERHVRYADALRFHRISLLLATILCTALLAGTSDHLRLVTGRRLAYTPEPVDYVYRPSVDVLFHSISELWTGDVVGVVL